MTVRTSSSSFDFPLTCLNTAEEKSFDNAYEGKNTIIDFWTTKCNRCPAALDCLDGMAQQERYSNVHFSSIVLDDCDGARNIIEEPNEKPRWGNIQHYHLEIDYKERAKEVFGFKQVPFYVVLNEKGEIVQKGSKKQIDFDSIPGISEQTTVIEEEKSESDQIITQDRVFSLDEDF